MPSFSEHFAAYVFGGFLILVTAVSIFAVRSLRRAREDMLNAVRSVGFIPAQNTDALLQRLTHLYQHVRIPGRTGRTPEYKLRDVFTRRLAGGDMYIFDLVDTSGSENTYTERQGIAVVSTRLNLPAFVVLPRLAGEGAFAKFADKMIAWIVAKMGGPVAFPNHPEFERHYIVSSPDPDAARRFLNGDRLGRLAGLKHVGVHAGDDIFTLSRYGLVSKPNTLPELRERVEQAERMFTILAP
ncbi:MAG TPA: hypothetical protein VJS69_11945 [Candidatus Krumholzibacteria bacterium]|nr:hypothetical protein [Candidatus Krumholzibacteria bacterium]